MSAPRLGGARRGMPTVTDVKLRAHAMMFDEGASRAAVARALNLAPNTVTKYVADVEHARQQARALKACGVRAAVLLALATGCGSPFTPCPDAGASSSSDASGADVAAIDAPPFDAGAGDAGDVTDAELGDVDQGDAGEGGGGALCCGPPLTSVKPITPCTPGAPWTCTHEGGAAAACDVEGACSVGDPCLDDAGAGFVQVCP